MYFLIKNLNYYLLLILELLLSILSQIIFNQITTKEINTYSGYSTTYTLLVPYILYQIYTKLTIWADK